MLGKKKAALELRKEKFENGLAKLENTEEQVDGLKETLVIK